MFFHLSFLFNSWQDYFEKWIKLSSMSTPHPHLTTKLRKNNRRWEASKVVEISVLKKRLLAWNRLALVQAHSCIQHLSSMLTKILYWCISFALDDFIRTCNWIPYRMWRFYCCPFISLTFSVWDFTLLIKILQNSTNWQIFFCRLDQRKLNAASRRTMTTSAVKSSCRSHQLAFIPSTSRPA